MIWLSGKNIRMDTCSVIQVIEETKPHTDTHVNRVPVSLTHSHKDKSSSIIRPGCLRPSVALTVQNRGLKH